ncbi:MAG TPA: alpha-L-arabinofuranosidase C-terminal domain-containing protein [Flavisolibacter sp.]|jgi:alpha-N-arabinofuranosidase|nr:alpha-L-arabinofuranosidase C-terminal domain-containing protein [Flavisolibacter sp.]
MDRRNFLNLSTLTGAGIFTGLDSLAGSPFVSSLFAEQASVTIHSKKEIGRIDKRIYGHFLEHVENVVYGGIYDPSSKFADEAGLRTDVMKAIKEMGGAQVIRWPGGNFVSYYHWKDGIGPKKNRPTKFDVVWKQTENNHFGTNEFLDLCRKLECEPFITANMGNGTIEEACEWVEYCKKVKNAPPVKLWGLGNEHFGPWQVGYYTAEEYGRKSQQFGQFMRAVDKDIELVGVGFTEPEWNETVLKHCGDQLDWLTIHLYGHRNLSDGGEDFDQLMITPALFEKEINEMSDVLAAYEKKSGKEKPIRICLEEWNDRHRRDGKLWRESPRNIVDALFVAGVFNSCQRLSSRVAMSNYVFLLNAHAPIVVKKEGVLKSATFDVFRLYATAMQPVAVQADVEAPSFTAKPVDEIGYRVDRETATAKRLDVSATRSVDGRKMSISLINRDRSKTMNVKLNLKDQKLAPGYTWHTLHSSDLTAINTIENPNKVRSTTKTFTTYPESVELKPNSLNIIELKLEA